MARALDTLKPRLYQAALNESFRSELELARAAWRPDAEDWADFVDMLAISWVDATGFTILERELGGISTAEQRRWHLRQRSGIFLVDAIEQGAVEVRDVETEESLMLDLAEPLSKGNLIRGRLIEEVAGTWTVTGQPDLFESVSVIQRMDLLHAWLDGPRHELLSAQNALRRAFLDQREQRMAFLEFFGTDMVLFESTEVAARQIDGFYQHLLSRFRPPSLAGETYLEEYLAAGTKGPTEHRLELDQMLGQCSSIAVIYDQTEGLHFLPDFKYFKDTVEGVLEPGEIVKDYLSDPGVTGLPFRRTQCLAYLRSHLDLPSAGLDEILALHKPQPSRCSPSLLPGPGQ